MRNPETTRPAAQATELTSGVGVRVIDLKGSTVFDSSVIIDEQQGDVFKSFAPQDTLAGGHGLHQGSRW